MKILEVSVEGIRGIPASGEGIDLNFQSEHEQVPNWIVIAGRNGAGKSTLLRAIALAIAGPAAARNLVKSFSNWIHDREDLASTTVKVEFSQSDSFKTGRPMTFNPSMALQWSRVEDGPAPVMERKIVGGVGIPHVARGARIRADGS
ncbi:AAA family ATPase [Microbacterium sp.]